jgi:hypothetical protein
MAFAAPHSFPWGQELIGFIGAALGFFVLRQVWRPDYVLPIWQRNSSYGQRLIAAGLPSIVCWTLMFIDGGLVSLKTPHHSIAGMVLLVSVTAISLFVVALFLLTVVAFLAFERLPSRLLPPCLRK